MSEAKQIETLRSALEAMAKEYRDLDLPYGSAAYQQAMRVLRETSPFEFGMAAYGLRPAPAPRISAEALRCPKCYRNSVVWLATNIRCDGSDCHWYGDFTEAQQAEPNDAALFAASVGRMKDAMRAEAEARMTRCTEHPHGDPHCMDCCEVRLAAERAAEGR